MAVLTEFHGFSEIVGGSNAVSSVGRMECIVSSNYGCILYCRLGVNNHLMEMWQFKSHFPYICSPLAHPERAKQRTSLLKVKCFGKNKCIYSHLEVHGP